MLFSKRYNRSAEFCNIEKNLKKSVERKGREKEKYKNNKNINRKITKNSYFFLRCA